MAAEKIWKDGFNVKNPEHLLKLSELAEDYVGGEAIGDKSELGKAYIEAKKAYYTDATLGPGYIKDLIGGINPKTHKANETRFAKALKKAGLSDVYEQYAADFTQAMDDRKAGVEGAELPTPPEELVKLIQKKLKIKESGHINAQTEDAIIAHKNKSWIDSRVTEASQGKIDDFIDAMQKVHTASRDPGSKGEAGDGPGGPPQGRAGGKKDPGGSYRA